MMHQKHQVNALFVDYLSRQVAMKKYRSKKLLQFQNCIFALYIVADTFLHLYRLVSVYNSLVVTAMGGVCIEAEPSPSSLVWLQPVV